MAESTKPIKSGGSWAEENAHEITAWSILGCLLAVLIYSYWNSLDSRGVYQFWDNPKYSHGWLVPIFTLVLLWLRYQPLEPATNSARWAGLGVLCGGLGIRLAATYYPNHVPEMASFVPCVAGLFLMVGGWKMFRWAASPIAFLIFMFPLPGFLDAKLLSPLQKLATQASTYCLQTIGIPAYSEGNRIVISEVQLGVVEACSGLRMLTIFVALAVAITLVTERPLWERVVIVLSAVPIALTVNIVRITVTGILHLTAGPELAEKVFHDWAGWLMMPMALGLLYVEFEILSHLVIEEGPSGPLQLS